MSNVLPISIPHSTIIVMLFGLWRKRQNHGLFLFCKISQQCFLGHLNQAHADVDE